MLGLIRKRHEGPGWQVFTELWNATGTRGRGRADAVAMGIWPSRGYEIHGYEVKESRGDLRKELQDVGKADAVGKYCDYWWLVIRDAKMTDGILLPSSWGILTPRDKVLRVQKKAVKRRASPMTREFAASMIRSVTMNWVPKQVHQKVIDDNRERIEARLSEDRLNGGDRSRSELEKLCLQIREFEAASGVKIRDAWAHTDIGSAVRTVLDAMHDGSRAKHQIDHLERLMKDYTKLAKDAQESAQQLRATLASMVSGPPPSPPCGAIFGFDEPFECDAPAGHVPPHSRGMSR